MRCCPCVLVGSSRSKSSGSGGGKHATASRPVVVARQSSSRHHNHHAPSPDHAGVAARPVAPRRTKHDRHRSPAAVLAIHQRHQNDADDASRERRLDVDENDNLLVPAAADTDDVTDSETATDDDDSSQPCKTLSLSCWHDCICVLSVTTKNIDRQYICMSYCDCLFSNLMPPRDSFSGPNK